MGAGAGPGVSCNENLIKTASEELLEVQTAILQLQQAMQGVDVKFTKIVKSFKTGTNAIIASSDSTSNNPVTRYNLVIDSVNNLPQESRPIIIKETLIDLLKVRSNVVTRLANTCR